MRDFETALQNLAQRKTEFDREKSLEYRSLPDNDPVLRAFLERTVLLKPYFKLGYMWEFIDPHDVCSNLHTQLTHLESYEHKNSLFAEIKSQYTNSKGNIELPTWNELYTSIPHSVLEFITNFDIDKESELLCLTQSNHDFLPHFLTDKRLILVAQAYCVLKFVKNLMYWEHEGIDHLPTRAGFVEYLYTETSETESEVYHFHIFDPVFMQSYIDLSPFGAEYMDFNYADEAHTTLSNLDFKRDKPNMNLEFARLYTGEANSAQSVSIGYSAKDFAEASYESSINAINGKRNANVGHGICDIYDVYPLSIQLSRTLVALFTKSNLLRGDPAWRSSLWDQRLENLDLLEKAQRIQDYTFENEELFPNTQDPYDFVVHFIESRDQKQDDLALLTNKDTSRNNDTEKAIRPFLEFDGKNSLYKIREDFFYELDVPIDFSQSNVDLSSLRGVLYELQSWYKTQTRNVLHAGKIFRKEINDYIRSEEAPANNTLVDMRNWIAERVNKFYLQDNQVDTLAEYIWNKLQHYPKRVPFSNEDQKRFFTISYLSEVYFNTMRKVALELRKMSQKSQEVSILHNLDESDVDDFVNFLVYYSIANYNGVNFFCAGGGLLSPINALLVPIEIKDSESNKVILGNKELSKFDNHINSIKFQLMGSGVSSLIAILRPDFDMQQSDYNYCTVQTNHAEYSHGRKMFVLHELLAAIRDKYDFADDWVPEELVLESYA